MSNDLPKSLATDAILLDDDELILRTWELSAELHQKRLTTCQTPNQLFELLSTTNKATPIYIDVDLKNEATGFEVAAKLHNQGFSNLFITTGYHLNKDDHPSYIQAIRGKEPPWMDNL